jgi:two-component system sensor histidine kinase KdpD
MDEKRPDAQAASERGSDAARTALRLTREPRRGARTSLHTYVIATLVVATCTVISLMLSPYLDRANLVMIYLLGVLFTAVRFGRAPSVLASFLGVAAFDFFLVPPLYTFAVADTPYLVTFAVMLGTGLIVSTLAVRLRDQLQEARRRERRAALCTRSAATWRPANETRCSRRQSRAFVRRLIAMPSYSSDEHQRIAPRTIVRSDAARQRENSTPEPFPTSRTMAGARHLTKRPRPHLPLEASRGAIRRSRYLR